MNFKSIVIIQQKLYFSFNGLVIVLTCTITLYNFLMVLTFKILPYRISKKWVKCLSDSYFIRIQKSNNCSYRFHLQANQTYSNCLPNPQPSLPLVQWCKPLSDSAIQPANINVIIFFIFPSKISFVFYFSFIIDDSLYFSSNSSHSIIPHPFSRQNIIILSRPSLG